jgi:rhomboid family GlyGly-CTERM serine protease
MLSGRQVPVVTSLLLGGAVVAALFPGCAAGLMYDRSAILSGEVWRLFTGHWVHFSLRHLAYDAVPLGMAGWMIETRGLLRFGWFCAIAPWSINTILLALDPQMSFCGGLSGLATAALVYLALCGLSDTGLWRWLCAATLLILAWKTGYELATGRTLLATLGDLPVMVSVSSHLAGAVTALAFYAAVQMPLRGRRLEIARTAPTALASGGLSDTLCRPVSESITKYGDIQRQRNGWQD